MDITYSKHGDYLLPNLLVLVERLVITMLYKDMVKAVNDYYNRNPRGLEMYDAKVDLKSLYGWSNFNVTVDVESFIVPIITQER